MRTWAPTCWSRVGVTGKKVLLVIGHIMMLYVTWLLFSGSLAQARINWDVEAPVTGMSVAIFYGSGCFFSVSAGLPLVRELIRVLTGKITAGELIGIQESEDLGNMEPLHIGETLSHPAAARGHADKR